MTAVGLSILRCSHGYLVLRFGSSWTLDCVNIGENGESEDGIIYSGPRGVGLVPSEMSERGSDGPVSRDEALPLVQVHPGS